MSCMELEWSCGGTHTPLSASHIIPLKFGSSQIETYTARTRAHTRTRSDGGAQTATAIRFATCPLRPSAVDKPLTS